MQDNNNNSGDASNKRSGTDAENSKLDIGNHMSAGNESGAPVSDFDAENDLPETEETGYQEENEGDNSESDNNGINPTPDQANPQSKEWSHATRIENADEDHMNPYPDELRPNDDDDKRHNSSWMSSGGSESN